MKKNISIPISHIAPSLSIETVRKLQIISNAVPRKAGAHGRFKAYGYLAAVYSIYAVWSKNGIASRKARIIARACNIPTRKGVSALRIIIDVTWPDAERKQKSRWVRALERAHDLGAAPRRLIPFIKANGGIAGCAALAAQDDPKKRTDRNDWA